MTPLKKRSELGIILDLLIKGFNKAEIKKKLNLSAPALSNHLRRLENKGLIERKGKYVINILKNASPSSLLTPRVTKNQVHFNLNKRGHAFNFKIVFPKEKNLLDKEKVKYELKVKNLIKLKFGSLKLIKDKNTIWINRNSLTIYSNNSYYSQNALHTKFRALKDIDNLIIYLMGRFGFTGKYGIEVFREHYGLIFNKFAKWFIKRGSKFYLETKGNKSILWVDNSRKDDIGLEEFESSDPIKINTADNYFNSHEKTNWGVTPEFILNGFNETNKAIQGTDKNIKETSKKLDYYAENQVTHVKLMKRITGKIEKMDGREERLTKAIEKLGEKL